MKKISLPIGLILLFCVPQSIKAVTIDPAQIVTDTLVIGATALYNSLLEDLTTLESTNEENLASAKLDTIATIETMAEAEAGLYAAAYEQHAIALGILENNREFSPNAQSGFGCCDKQLGIGLIQGISKQKEYQTELYNTITSYNNDHYSHTELLKTLTPIADLIGIDRAWSIFPLHETIASPQNTIETIILNTNPMPAIKLKPAVLATPMGQHYELLRKIQLSKLAIPQQVMSDISSYHMPAYPLADWYDQMQLAKGVPNGSSEAIVENELSADAILKMQVQSRYGNPNWGFDIHRKFKDGILRELLQMEAIDLKFQQRLLKLNEQRLAIIAQDHANLLAKKYDHQINNFRKQAMILQNED